LLLDIVLKHQLKSVSVVGMAKNVGKTVTLNHLVAEAAVRGLTLGLISIGRDGEGVDAVFNIPKPGIYAPTSTLLATTLGSLAHREVELDLLAGTGYSTAMGEVFLYRVITPGFVELTGPTLGWQQRKVVGTLFAYGADLVLVDGALDRVSSAAPTLADGVILATGAALGSTIPDVLAKTLDRVERFALPQVTQELLPFCLDLMHQAKATLVTQAGEMRLLAVGGSLISGEAIAQSLTPDTRLVVLAGAVGDGVLAALNDGMARAGPIHLVIRSGASLFAARQVWRGFVAAGGSISVTEPIRLAAVTLNPTSPLSPGFDQEAFLKAAGEVFLPYPVVDVVAGKGYRV